MKKLALLLGLLSCVATGRAVPVLHFTFYQDNWQVAFRASLEDNGVYGNTAFYFNGVLSTVGGGDWNWQSPILNTPLLQENWVYGENTISARLVSNGVPYGDTYSATFTIIEPNGPRPTQVVGLPDNGNTLVFLLVGVVALLCHGLLPMATSSKRT